MSAFDLDESSSSTVSITVLSVTPARAEKLFAFASVEIDIDGVQIGVCGIRAMHAGPEAVAIELPKFRDADGVWRTAITLPEEIYTPIARAVLDELVERGLTARPADDDRRPGDTINLRRFPGSGERQWDREPA
jgi:stage V sporulation protein G